MIFWNENFFDFFFIFCDFFMVSFRARDPKIAVSTALNSTSHYGRLQGVSALDFFRFFIAIYQYLT